MNYKEYIIELLDKVNNEKYLSYLCKLLTVMIDDKD